MTIRKNATPESVIENRGAIAENLPPVPTNGNTANFTPSENQRDDAGNDVEDTGLRLGTPTANDDTLRVHAVMDAICDLYTDNEERTSAKTGEVYVVNKREFAGHGMLRQFIRQIAFDLDGLKKRIATEELKLARENRKINADQREINRVEMQIERMVDSFAERSAMKREAIAYYAELTGEFYEGAAPAQPAPDAKPVSDWEARQKARAALING